MSNRLRAVIIVIVSLVWAANMVAPIAIKDYKPSPDLNVAFMAILGILTASFKREKAEGQNEEDDSTGE